MPPIEQVKIHGSASVVNNCTATLRPPISIVPDGPSSVTVAISTDASPQPHLGDPITLSNTKVTVTVPPDLLQTGYDTTILTANEVIPSTLTLNVKGSNTTEGTHAFAAIHASPKLSVTDPDGIPLSGDEVVHPLSVTVSLPNTLWHPKDKSQPVFFSENTALIKATLVIGAGADAQTYTYTETCSTPKAPAFVALSASGIEPPTTVAVPVTAAAVTTTTTAAVAAAATLPRTGASVVLWLVIAGVMLDLGAVAVVGTRKRAHSYLHR